MKVNIIELEARTIESVRHRIRILKEKFVSNAEVIEKITYLEETVLEPERLHLLIEQLEIIM